VYLHYGLRGHYERAGYRPGSVITNESRLVQIIFNQTPIDPDQFFNRDHDRVGKSQIKPCRKFFNQSLLKKIQSGSGCEKLS